MILRLLLLFFLIVLAVASAVASDVDGYYPFLKTYSDAHPPALSYLARDWPEREVWRTLGRAKMLELLAYDPAPAPLNPEILETIPRSGYQQLRVRYAIAAGRTTEAFLLIPDSLSGSAPAVIALHDHGGFYFYGKEKVTQTDASPKILQDFLQRYYGGTYADELARRGFVVLVPDAFYFGAQRLDPSHLSDYFLKENPDLNAPDLDKRIQAFNRFASSHEQLTAKTIFTAGSTWPGILFQGDRASVDYLLTRPEVDPERIGCIGLSIGGFRSAHLFGLDSRIKAAVVAGWMTSYSSLLFDHLRSHTWMIYVPQQVQFLDLPDVASLNAPRPLMVINCLQDTLFTHEGMQEAERKLAAVYAKFGAPDHFRCAYYNVPHSLNVAMQDDAIAWLEQGLGK